ncbi:MAG: serine/threonine protein kinase [candidate division WOR-3 bacterium]|nr:MAG: serine/threonine protein kinase [candidate division WOR-3 bacterium]
MVNQTIKDYEIKELIATGGMAAIYRAVDTSTGNIVAIKILHGHLAQDKDFITRFEREAHAAANLKHDNIIDILGYGEAAGVYYIAMEYVEGKSLKDLINTVTFMPHDIALAIVYDICQGIEHAHQKGVVHRDIKPANILVNKDGRVKITDFGLAQAQDLTSITVTGAIVGTPAYMSPEQAAGKRIDTRSDIFSLGVVIYEMITGSKPFQGESYSSVIHAILTIPAPRPIDANPIVEDSVSAIIEKMLQKDASKRYQNISRVSEDVYAYFREHNIEVPSKKIGEFIAEPDRISVQKKQEAKERYMKRGLHYMTLGKGNIDDAIKEFEKVQYLDPEDVNAKTHLTQLKRKRKTAPPVMEKESPKGKKKFPIGIAAIVTAAVVVIVLSATFLRNYGNQKPGLMYGSIFIDSRPAEASIYLDDIDLNLNTPFRVDSIATGDHTIEVRKRGYRTYTQKITLGGGETISVNARLIQEIATVSTGNIKITSKPSGAAVVADGKDTGLQTPCTLKGITAGQHVIQLVKSGYQTYELKPVIQSDQTTSASVNLTKIQQRETRRKAQKSYFRINVDPWARIYIDGKYIETTPLAKSIEVTSGSHRVRLENPNFQTWQRNINFKPGQTVSMDVKLEPFAGSLKISVRPWADVYIDGKFYETTPIAKPIDLSAGRHTLKLINPSFVPYEEVIVIEANKTLRKSIELSRK